MVQPNGPPARTITVELDMGKAFDTINIHTLIRKLLQTNIPGTTMKFITNYIKGRKAYISYRNHTSIQRQFKLALLKVAYSHPHYSTFTLQTYHHPEHRFRSWPTLMTSPSHLHTQVRVQPRNTYNHTYIKFCLENLTLNADKTCTLFTYTLRNTRAIWTSKYTKLTYSTHIHNISVHAHTPLQLIKAHTATGWGKQNETLMTSYKAVMRPTLEYASSASLVAPFLKSYVHKVDAKSHPSPLYSLCNTHIHDTHHIFNCTHICTTLSPLDLWTDPAGVTELLVRWTEKLAGGPQSGRSDSPH